MSDESKTQEQADPRSFEERVFARFDAMEARLASLEEKVDARLRETRSMWEAMPAQLQQIGDGVEDINRQLREMAFDSLKMRARIGKLEDRERTPAV